MHPPRDIHQTIVELADTGRAIALAVVLAAEGSTPCKAGAKAIVEADGSIRGTVGGGSVEAETQRLAAEAIRTRRAIVLDFDLEGTTPGHSKPICGGRMRVLVDPEAARHRAAFAAAATARKQRTRGVLLTTLRRRGEIRRASDWEVHVQFLPENVVARHLAFPGPEAIGAALKREQATLLATEASSGGGVLEALVEPLVPKPVVLIVGGGHVGQAVARQADLAGFDIAVIDDRPEFSSPELFPQGATTCCGPVGQQLARFPVDADTYIVIATHGHQHDAEALAAALATPAAYVGMIGSRRKVAMMRKDLVASGRATAAQLDRVYAPIGLEIGAATVPEIAASIVAQLIAVRRLGAAPRISPANGP